MIKKTVKSALIFTLPVILTACASDVFKTNLSERQAGSVVYLMYPGQNKTFNDVGVIATDQMIFITKVDGQSARSIYRKISNTKYLSLNGAQTQYHFLPGKHVIEFCFSFNNGVTSGACTTGITKVLDFSAGTIYSVSYIRESDRSWSLGVVDGSQFKGVLEQYFDFANQKK